MARRMTKGQKKVRLVMRHFKAGALHSGKSGRIVRARKQAIAIALNMGRKASRKRRR